MKYLNTPFDKSDKVSALRSISILKNWFYYVIGVVFLLLSKLRFLSNGYSPKSISVNEFKKCADHDFRVVDRWVNHLVEYTGKGKFEVMRNKNILELGPGSDLGSGLYILARSAKEYNAVDIYNLIKDVPDGFYDFFFEKMRLSGHDDIESLKDELKKFENGRKSRINYFYQRDFDIVKALGSRKVDLVVSNAAFEHFDNIEQTIRALGEVTVSGGIFIALVDLKTHSRWIRDKDPNSIYRYSNGLFDLLSFPGTPNRIRPYQYKQALEDNGWKNVSINAINLLNAKEYFFMIDHLHPMFRDAKNQMDQLTVMICATKS